MKITNNHTNNISKLFDNYLKFYNNFKSLTTYSLYYFSIFIHKKLHYFNIYINNKNYIISNGQLLRVRTKLTKFFKKSRKSYGASINALNKKLKKNFLNINFFFCKNFCYKNYLWLKKFYNLINPQINYFICTTGYNYMTKYRRRIKKKILRNLIKSSFIV